MDFNYVLANRRGSMFFYSLRMKMACSITDVICIALITLEDINKPSIDASLEQAFLLAA